MQQVPSTLFQASSDTLHPGPNEAPAADPVPSSVQLELASPPLDDDKTKNGPDTPMCLKQADDNKSSLPQVSCFDLNCGFRVMHYSYLRQAV